MRFLQRRTSESPRNSALFLTFSARKTLSLSAAPRRAKCLVSMFPSVTLLGYEPHEKDTFGYILGNRGVPCLAPTPEIHGRQCIVGHPAIAVIPVDGRSLPLPTILETTPPGRLGRLRRISALINVDRRRYHWKCPGLGHMTKTPSLEERRTICERRALSCRRCCQQCSKHIRSSTLFTCRV